LKKKSCNEEPWYYVSIGKAESDLNCFLDDICPAIKSSSNLVVAQKYTITTQSTKTGEDPIIMHVFNFEDNQGYAIMPGDKRVPSPMCFVEKGQFVDNDPTTELDDFIVSELMGMYQAARALPDSIKYEISPLSGDYTLPARAEGFSPVDTVFENNKYYVYYNWAQNGNPNGSLLETHWKQWAPFNDFCPIVWDSTNTFFRRAPAGCTIIAVGQIMAYWQLAPPVGNPYFGLNWNYISPIIDENSVPTDYTGWLMLKNLLVILGNTTNLNASYSYYGTGASQYNVNSTFVNFGYSNGGSIKDYNIDSVRLALNRGPVLGVGYSKLYHTTDGSSICDDGHTWVFDQCFNRKRPVMVYDSSWHIITGQMQTSSVLHINWGWGGAFDGYFANSRFDIMDSSSDPLYYTKSIVDTIGVDGYYQYNLQMNTGIRP